MDEIKENKNVIISIKDINLHKEKCMMTMAKFGKIPNINFIMNDHNDTNMGKYKTAVEELLKKEWKKKDGFFIMNEKRPFDKILNRVLSNPSIQKNKKVLLNNFKDVKKKDIGEVIGNSLFDIIPILCAEDITEIMKSDLMLAFQEIVMLSRIEVLGFQKVEEETNKILLEHKPNNLREQEGATQPILAYDND